MINEIFMWTLAVFLLIGAVDRILSELGQVYKGGKLHTLIGGSGEKFEEALNAMGPLAFGMVGVIVAVPDMCRVLTPGAKWFFSLIGASPSVLSGVIACDMGGFSLAKVLATNTGGEVDYGAAYFAGGILGSMLGATVVFNIPVGLVMIQDTENRKQFSYGILIGLATLPFAAFVGGVMLVLVPPEVPAGDLASLEWPQLGADLFPPSFLALSIILGLKFYPASTIQAFLYFGSALTMAITALLSCISFQTLTGSGTAGKGVALIPGLQSMFPVAGDIPDSGNPRSMEVVGRIGIALLGAYPLTFLISKWCSPLNRWLATKLAVSEGSVAGVITSLANALPMFSTFKSMDGRGQIVNAAFCVGGSFTFGDHLAFFAATAPALIPAVVAAKLTAGLSAVVLALLLTGDMKDSQANVEQDPETLTLTGP